MPSDIPTDSKSVVPEIPTTTDKLKEHDFWQLDMKKFYNKDVCELTKFNSNELRNIFTKIISIKEVRVGKEFLQEQFKGNIKPIINSGEYSKLYKGLSEDVEIEELILGGERRMFYFLKENTVCIIAITKHHLETKKNRR